MGSKTKRIQKTMNQQKLNALNVAAVPSPKGIVLHVQGLFLTLDVTYDRKAWQLFCEDLRAVRSQAAGLIARPNTVDLIDSVDHLDTDADPPSGYAIKITADAQHFVLGIIHARLTTHCKLPVALLDELLRRFEVAETQHVSMKRQAEETN